MRPLSLVLVSVAGCGLGPPPPLPAPPKDPAANVEAPEGTMRYLALGDSYTIGESVKEAERWPVQLVAALKKDGVTIADPQIIARTGWTTGELINALDRKPPKGPYDLVSLLIGVNNQYRGLEIKEYREQFVDLLKRSTTLAGGKADRVVVVSIPDWGVTPFAKGRGVDAAAVGKAIDSFNDVNREETKKAGAVYVEITVASRKAPKEPALIAEDGLHPSAAMYAEWVTAALPAAKKIVGGGKP